MINKLFKIFKRIVLEIVYLTLAALFLYGGIELLKYFGWWNP